MNHNLNYLYHCKKCKELILYKNIEAKRVLDGVVKPILPKSKLHLTSFKTTSDGVILILKFKEVEYEVQLKWSEPIPFTHYKNAKEAYDKCKFTGMVLDKDLEDFIFIKSAKYACLYAINVSKKRLSPALEEKVLSSYRYVQDYCVYFNITLTEKQEEVFFQDESGDFAAVYAINKGKFSETIHNYLLMKSMDKKNSYWLKKYFDLRRSKT